MCILSIDLSPLYLLSTPSVSKAFLFPLSWAQIRFPLPVIPCGGWWASLLGSYHSFSHICLASQREITLTAITAMSHWTVITEVIALNIFLRVTEVIIVNRYVNNCCELCSTVKLENDGIRVWLNGFSRYHMLNMHVAFVNAGSRSINPHQLKSPKWMNPTGIHEYTQIYCLPHEYTLLYDKILKIPKICLSPLFREHFQLCLLSL